MMLMMMYRQRLPKGLPSNTFSGARCAAAAVNATNGLTSPPHTFIFRNILSHFWSFGTPLVTEVRLRSHNHQKSLIHQSINVYKHKWIYNLSYFFCWTSDSASSLSWTWRLGVNIGLMWKGTECVVCGPTFQICTVALLKYVALLLKYVQALRY